MPTTNDTEPTPVDPKEGDQLGLLEDTAKTVAENGDTPPGASATTPEVEPEPPKRGRGRPKGSRNKPKDAPAADADKPKPKPRTRKPKAPPEEERAPSAKKLSDLVGGMSAIMLAGGFLSPKLMYDAQVLAAQADAIGRELHKLAKVNPAVARALNRVMKSSDYAGLVGVAIAVVVPIGANHGMVPREIVGLIPGAPELPPAAVSAPADEGTDTAPVGQGLGAIFGEAVVNPPTHAANDGGSES